MFKELSRWLFCQIKANNHWFRFFPFPSFYCPGTGLSLRGQWESKEVEFRVSTDYYLIMSWTSLWSLNISICVYASGIVLQSWNTQWTKANKGLFSCEAYVSQERHNKQYNKQNKCHCVLKEIKCSIKKEKVSKVWGNQEHWERWWNYNFK